ncbi:hypothetical protein COLU111180_18555 [Cohnella lubricantis]|uniref:Uncharacterized protein n=1 Tax=Cohnella lubricantis TaxID=2163172 RepID=A0A841T4N8_9BACL|nr:hypothetical protein [Cohnella lubricantis]MBB6675802.1 hypothetical protein [Cohnella lubricantis]MBP2119881.1 hypothetical protein [Cohnella lubricantis]
MDDNLIPFPKIINMDVEETILLTTTEDRGKMWDHGFVTYAYALGMKEISKQSGGLVFLQNTDEQLYHGIRMMAEADYWKMAIIVPNVDLIELAFSGNELQLLRLQKEALKKGFQGKPKGHCDT